MTVTLNDTTAHATGKLAVARFLATVLAPPGPPAYGRFVDAVDDAGDRIPHLDDDREVVVPPGPGGPNLSITIPYGGAA
jgi:hypothetical protein